MKIDNSAMNQLVFKYGPDAKTNGIQLGAQVKTIATGTSTAAEKLLADQIGVTNVVTGAITNGTACDDNNVMTVNDIYTNNVCAGTLTVNGTACNDGNSATVGETWLNGICQGGVLGNLSGNGLIYDNCEGGAQTWTNAGTYCASKGMRLPALAETSYGTTNGVPSCSSGYTWTSTPCLYGYYMWTASSYSPYGYISYAYGVRCVK